MASAYEKTASSESGLKGFMIRYSRLIIVLAAVLLAAIITTIVVVEVNRSKNLEGLSAVEELEQSFYSYLTGADEAVDAEGLKSQAAQLIERYPRSFPAQRAHLLLGLLAEESSDLASAATHMEAVAEIPVDSHLVEVALLRAYAYREEAGELAQAKANLSRLLELGPDSVQAPRALFNLGRLAEVEGNSTEALEYYNRLSIEYPASSWTNLGKDRIILLNR